MQVICDNCGEVFNREPYKIRKAKLYCAYLKHGNYCKRGMRVGLLEGEKAV